MRESSGSTPCCVHQPTRKKSVTRALFGLLLLAVATVALSTASCSSPGYRCEGTPGKCSTLAAAHCSADVGCPAAATALCVQIGYGCALSDFDGTACVGPTCELDEQQRCRTVCAGASDAEKCLQKGAKCAWVDGSCTTLCETRSDESSCSADPACLWLACRGKPRACDEFSGDACPTWLGCEKVKGHVYSAQ